jgi:uncharacterized membrane protein
MSFLVLCLFVSGVAFVAHRLSGSRPGLRATLRYGLAGGFLFTGVDHFVHTHERYVPMIPSFLAPAAAELVYLTGIAEILGAVGLLVPLAVYRRLRLPDLRWWAGVGLTVLLASVVVANINVALQGQSVQGLEFGTWYLWLRPFAQPVIMAWALYAGGVWPAVRVPAQGSVEAGRYQFAGRQQLPAMRSGPAKSTR